MTARLSRFLQDESGSNLIEYGFTIALIVIGIIGSITAMGGSIAGFLTNAAAGLR